MLAKEGKYGCVSEDIDRDGDFGQCSKKNPKGGHTGVTVGQKRVVGEISTGHTKALD